jgi:hypothetical protein
MIFCAFPTPQSFPSVIWITRESGSPLPPYNPDDRGTTAVQNMYYLRNPACTWVSQQVKRLFTSNVTADQIYIAQCDSCLKLTLKCQHKIYKWGIKINFIKTEYLDNSFRFQKIKQL